MSLSNKKRSQLTEEVKVSQTREVKLKHFKARLFLANEILQEMGEQSRLRFTGIDVSFPEAITTQLYPNLIFRFLPKLSCPSPVKYSVTEFHRVNLSRTRFGKIYPREREMNSPVLHLSTGVNGI